MSNENAQQGQVITTAAEVYEEFFVPSLFGQWTEPMLDACQVGVGDMVLDVGCGTGVLARAAAGRVGSSGAVTGLDRNDGMLAVAERSAETVAWENGVAESLPFPDGHFDRVVSQFALMFFDDRAQATSELARVLRPGGTLAIATWASVEESPGYAAMVEVLREVVGEEAATALLAPFTIGDSAALADILKPSFPDVSVRKLDGTARFESIDAWVHTDIRGWTLADMVDDQLYGRILERARTVNAPFIDDVGRVSFAAPALIATATKPQAD